MIDLHAHILPGLDDGACDEAEALEMCRIAAAEGVTAIVASPHMGGGSAVRRQDALSATASLQAAAMRVGIPLRIIPGGDVHAEGDLVARLDAGDFLTIGDEGKYLLVELNHDMVAPGIEDMLFALRLRRLRPIITHPERNPAIQAEPELLRKLVQAGNAAQVTAGSLTGEFGREAERTARLVLRRRMAHFVASDAHSTEKRSPRLRAARRVAEEALGADEASWIFERRPAQVISGAEVELPLPADAPRLSLAGAWNRCGRRVRRMFN